jgi:hypothetical protein
MARKRTSAKAKAQHASKARSARLRASIRMFKQAYRQLMTEFRDYLDAEAEATREELLDGQTPTTRAEEE